MTYQKVNILRAKPAQPIIMDNFQPNISELQLNAYIKFDPGNDY